MVEKMVIVTIIVSMQVGPDSDNGDIAQDGGHQHHGDEGSVRY